jgi:hypothetical protein
MGAAKAANLKGEDMKTKLLVATLVLALAAASGFAQEEQKTKKAAPPNGTAAHYPAAPTDKLKAKEKKQVLAQPDLKIRQFLFPPANDKALRVQVENVGAAASSPCRLILTVRKINGIAVGRKTHVNVPALAPGKQIWLVVNAKSILPNNISLESTTFKLNVDGTGIVAESDETNNESWHNL